MLIQFTLTMPSNNSWSRRWSGDGKLYAVVKNIRSNKSAHKILSQPDYYYNFHDGWCASISVKQIDATSARKVRKNSLGFCGYDWMIKSIELHGEIKS